MARFWTERLDLAKHVDYMATSAVGGSPVEPPGDNLIERLVYFVAVCGFEFQFHSLGQLREALEFFERKHHPSSRLPGVYLEHYWQRWYERLPQWLFEESKRVRVVKALSRALQDFEQKAVGRV